MTRLFGRWVHKVRGAKGGWLIVVGRHATAGPRCWFGRTPDKGAGREWEVFDGGDFKWRRGFWGAGSEVWTLAEIKAWIVSRVAGVAVVLAGLAAFAAALR